MRVLAALLAMLMLLMAAPGTALACPIPIRKIGPLKLKKSDLRSPVMRSTTARAWKVSDAWVSTRPRLSQFVRIRGLGTFHGRSYRTQRALSIDAYAPEDGGWMYFDDGDPATPRCKMVGKVEWQRPRIRVKQTKREVRVLAITRRTPGDRAGCSYGPDEGIAECPTLARSVVRLKQPVGNRKIVFEQLSGQSVVS